MFKVGDAVVHPIRGAGIVVDIEELERREGPKPYYNIDLIAHPDTILMIPVSKAEDEGIRQVISKSNLEEVWHILDADPEELPSNYRTRHKAMKEKLQTGDIRKIAEAIRDMAWYRRQRGELTTRGRRIYQRGMSLLAGEVAATREIGVNAAKAQIRKKLRKNLPRVTDEG